jgi:hypothetical protein
MADNPRNLAALAPWAAPQATSLLINYIDRGQLSIRLALA